MEKGEYGAEASQIPSLLCLFYKPFILVSAREKMRQHRNKGLTLITFPPTLYQSVMDIDKRICETIYMDIRLSDWQETFRLDSFFLTSCLKFYL